MSQPEENIDEYSRQKTESKTENKELQAFTYIFEHKLRIYKKSSDAEFRIKRRDFDLYCFQEIENMRKSFIEQANIKLEEYESETETSTSEDSSDDLDDLDSIEDLNSSNQKKEAA